MQPYTKAIISNNLVEITQQAYSPNLKRTSLGGRKPLSNQSTENHEANIKVSINRARKNIRRLLECNFTNQYAFITLTFKPTKEVDLTSVKACNKLFRDFKKRLSYYLQKNNLGNFLYLGVTEFNNNKGDIHFHLVCNLIDLSKDKLEELWSYGWAHKVVANSNPSDNEKIAFYLNKGISDQRLNGHKRYFKSQNLREPIIHEVENPSDFYSHLDKCKPCLKGGETYHSPYTGETKYEQYYLEDSKELINYVQDVQ
ncbi:rolling circle replication-associated protein [Guptibacillus algicola]|uniref:rolling circle replication-associated protein n=1 Tax=Guptibacillus algicola TaxID=225844 RepID=UPI001CD24B14|nr:hypothetical protein [Alkalihalobacillus algicola]MCA0986571.1 hypothetical protein [Alkalihalobacillus algicola]